MYIFLNSKIILFTILIPFHMNVCYPYRDKLRFLTNSCTCSVSLPHAYLSGLFDWLAFLEGVRFPFSFSQVELSHEDCVQCIKRMND